MPGEELANYQVSVGKGLVRVCKTPSVDGFIDYVKEKWSKYLLKNDNTEQS
jgi:hypothetical protein